MSAPSQAFPIGLPRHSFSARDAARAGDVWRGFQEIAVTASTLAGWPPGRYREEHIAFVVRSMVVVHHREATYGEETRGETWVSRFRRQRLCTREVRLLGDAGPVASATQEWVHVNHRMEMVPAPEILSSAFPVWVRPDAPSVTMPAYEKAEGATHGFAFPCWHTWMDPLAHANHPAYLDWCEEAIARVVFAAGVDPLWVSPLAEEVTFKTGVVAPGDVHVETKAVGMVGEDAVVFAHVIRSGGVICANATTVRRLLPAAGTGLRALWGL